MKLNEIFYDPHTSKELLVNQIDDYSKSILNHKEEWESIGKEGKVEFDILFGWESNCQAFAHIGDNIIALLGLSKIKRPAWKVNFMACKTKYQGQGVAVEVYKRVVLNDMVIVSGSTQTSGSIELWKKLSDIPGIEVIAYNRNTKEATELSSGEIEDNFDDYYEYGNEFADTDVLFVASMKNET